MELPTPRSYQHHPENTSVGAQTSPISSTSSPRTMLPGMNPFGRASTGSGLVPNFKEGMPQQYIGTRSPGGSNPPNYNHSYGTASTSPSAASGSFPEPQTNEPLSLMSIGMSPQISSSNLNTQKRAYRQRRKDPSCDACRERKVKCDATETSACSECSSRNHKCQFTKDTNRRMSSIKQLEDLKSQLADARKENTHLRSLLPNRNTLEFDRGPTKPNVERVDEPSSLPQRIKPPVIPNFDHVRRNIRTYTQDIFESDPTRQSRHTLTQTALTHPDLPLRADFALLSRAYLDSTHGSFPVIHWPTFQHEVDHVYAERSFADTTQNWIGLFFAVMACGTLQISKSSPAQFHEKGQLYLETSIRMLTPGPAGSVLTYAKASLLISIFAHESNLKALGSVWLSSAVRAAQDAELHVELGPKPVIEEEMNRRLWWSIYTWERISCFEALRPTLINDDDCAVSLPSVVEDRYIQPQGIVRTPSTYALPCSGLAALIPIMRLLQPLYRATKPSIISPHTLQSYEKRFDQVLDHYPDSYRSDSDAYLEPASLPSILSIQLARFHLYRRNLSLVCGPNDRAEAFRRTTSVAQDTAKYISRTLPRPSVKPDSQKSWNVRVMEIASSSICRHLWRCMLVLCFNADYEAALACLQLASAIGHLRKVNVACAKHLIFFLERLTDRIVRGNFSVYRLEDEEMIAYVSADLQASSEHSWVWSIGDGLSKFTSPVTSGETKPQVSGESSQGSLPLRPRSVSLEQETRDWDGWGRIEQMIRRLQDEHHTQMAQPSTYYLPPHNPVKRLQLAPDTSVSAPVTSSSMPSSSSSMGTARISIANII